MNSKNLPTLYFLVDEDNNTIVDVCRSYEEAYSELEEKAKPCVAGCWERVNYSIIKGKRKTFSAVCEVSIKEEIDEQTNEE